MPRLENDLRGALRRRPAPPGFAARVLSRIEEEPPLPAAMPRRRRMPVVWAVAATLALALGIGLIQHERRVEHRNRAALQETLTALRIAAAELHRAQDKALSASRWEQLGERLQVLSADEPRAALPDSTHSTGEASRI